MSDKKNDTSVAEETTGVSAAETAEIAIVDERTIRDKIYEIRGVKVMLDFELAEIYGYETKNFNRQVKNNAERFEGDEFMFRLTREEVDELVRCKNFTSREGNFFRGQSGGSRYLPNAFTEQGVYLLMTVLRGDLAVRQTRALVMAFKAMKDYLYETRGLVTQRDALQLSMRISENSAAIRNVQTMLNDQQKILVSQQKLLLEHDDKLVAVVEKANNAVQRSELSPVFTQFDPTDDKGEFLLLNGQPARADETYINIYAKAHKSVFMIDNYINIKTLRLLQDVKAGVDITVFSDNLYNKLHASDYADFQIEFPHLPITFLKTAGIMHDRFIVLDYEEPTERIYHCGASSKDAAVKLTSAIVEVASGDMIKQMHGLIDQMKNNPTLLLR